MFSVFAVSISALATSRTCVEPPEMPSTSCETMVCAESTIASVGRVLSISPSTVARSVVDASSRFCSIALTRDARRRTCACDSSPETYSTEPLGCLRRCCRSLQQQCRLADAGFARDQHDRAGHDAAAEHTVELAETRGQP